jgi:hypothetical protein
MGALMAIEIWDRQFSAYSWAERATRVKAERTLINDESLWFFQTGERWNMDRKQIKKP